MVRGLEVFQARLSGHAGKFVLIGGTAASIAMEESGLEFRATKDLDIVLLVEVLDTSFVSAVWDFVKEGGYEIRQSSTTGKPVFYRFMKPTDATFPAILELFSRAPAGIALALGSELTPIPTEEAISGLSAILLDDAYYGFIVDGRRESGGLPWVGADRLIPLKACAWLNLSAAKARGDDVDARNIRKHANDVLRLSQLLAPQDRIQLPEAIADHLAEFLTRVLAEGTLDPSSLGLTGDLETFVQRIAKAFDVPMVK